MKKNRKIKKEHFANLLAVAYADGIFKPEELDFLAEKAIEYGLEDSEVHQLLENIEQLKFSVPQNFEEKEQQLTDAIYLTMIDGQIDKREYQLCLQIAKKLDLDQKYLDNLIELIQQLWNNEEKQQD